MFSVVALGVFFSDIFISDYPIEIVLIYLLLCITVVLVSFVYTKRKIPNYRASLRAPTLNISGASVVLWCLSLPAIAAQLYFIYLFGGLDGYITAAKHGTKNFWGLGPLKTLVTTFYSINLLYFGLLINSKKDLISCFIFSIHFTTFIFIALLTLSRGTLLTQIIFMALIFHFSHKKIGLTKAVIGLSILLAVASVYGVLRESVTWDNRGFKLNYGNVCDTCDQSNKEYYKSEWSYFGLFPLQRVIEAEDINVQYGLTYVTLFTNFIPRKIWPDKPDPGGVVLTKD
jgi:oligosaccharide repeat unit polymerase